MWGKDDMRPNGRYCLHFCHYGIITLLPLHATSNKSNEMPIHKLHESVTLYVAKGPSCEAATQYNDPHMLPKDVKKRNAITCCLKMSMSNKESNTHTPCHIHQTSLLLHTPACDKLADAINCFQSTAACPSTVLVWRTRAGQESHASRKCSRMISEILTKRSPTRRAGGSNTTRCKPCSKSPVKAIM